MTGAPTGALRSWRGLQAGDPRLRVIRFRRNFGQTAAFAAGFAHARGRLIVTSDGDLQNDPHDIPAMVDQLEGGFDIVCGWRKDRKDALVSRRLPSTMANALISAVTGVHLHDYGCSLKVFRAEIVKRHETVRRDAPVPSGHRQRAGRRASASAWSTIARASTVSRSTASGGRFELFSIC